MDLATQILDAVDTDRYPLHEPDSAALTQVVEQARAGLSDVGCCVLPDFIRSEHREELRRQGQAVAPAAHDQMEQVNAYNLPLDTPFPEDHPGRIVLERGNAFVARDQLPVDSLIQQLYTSAEFKSFLARCFQLPHLHEYADPLAGLTLNVVAPGQSHPWHFDSNEFTVTMLTQQAEAGGVFEYCPSIRAPQAENLDAVRDVITGSDDSLVRRLQVSPGDLQLFCGRFALHRVTPVEGGTSRHTAIFAYSDHPGVVGSVERTRQLFGRVLPVHHEAAKRADGLLD